MQTEEFRPGFRGGRLENFDPPAKAPKPIRASVSGRRVAHRRRFRARQLDGGARARRRRLLGGVGDGMAQTCAATSVRETILIIVPRGTASKNEWKT